MALGLIIAHCCLNWQWHCHGTVPCVSTARNDCFNAELKCLQMHLACHKPWCWSIAQLHSFSVCHRSGSAHTQPPLTYWSSLQIVEWLVFGQGDSECTHVCVFVCVGGEGYSNFACLWVS